MPKKCNSTKKTKSCKKTKSTKNYLPMVWGEKALRTLVYDYDGNIIRKPNGSAFSKIELKRCPDWN
jgi:hypothetical protein